MIHRRCLKDDARGVDEPLNETEAGGKGLTQYVRHYVVFNGEYRKVQKRNDQRPLPIFAPTSINSFAKIPVKITALPVPDDVKLYLRPYEDGSYLLRLHNTNTKSGVRLY
jgi:hypothetical protein